MWIFLNFLKINFYFNINDVDYVFLMLVENGLDTYSNLKEFDAEIILNMIEFLQIKQGGTRNKGEGKRGSALSLIPCVT